MRVCFIEDTNLHGGTQIWVTEAARHFMAAGVEVTVLTPDSGWVAPQAAADGARVATYDYLDVITENKSCRKIWAEALADCDAAICTVHPPRDGFHCSLFAARVIQEHGLGTTLITKTGTIVPEYKREFYLPDESVKSAVISIADFTRNYLIDTYKIPEEKVALIYQGSDLETFTRSDAQRAEAIERYPLPEGAAPILGNVGSFEERKGQIYLLKAVAELRKTCPDVHLLLVGDGPDDGMLKDTVSTMGIEKHVSIFPFTSEPVLVFEAIDILVLSSLFKEGLPNVLLESMCMEKPVVSTRLAGVPEVVKDGETGYMVEPGNHIQIADAVGKLWADRTDYTRMAQNARRLMTERFSKARQFGAFVDYIRKITEPARCDCPAGKA